MPAAGLEAAWCSATGEGESEAGTPVMGQGRGGRLVSARSSWLGRFLPLYCSRLVLPALPETNQTVPGLPCCIFLPEDRRQSDERGHQFCAAREKINL